MNAWGNLNHRERLLIGLAIPIIILLIGYFYLWVPVNEKLIGLRNEVPLKSAELAWMEHELDLAASWIKKSSVADSRQPLLTVIEKQANQAGIKQSIQRVQPDANNEVKMWFQDVEADKWLRFVNQLAVNRISVEAATITRKSDGVVNIRSTFVR